MNGFFHWLIGFDPRRMEPGGKWGFRLLTPPEPWVLAIGLVLAIAVVALCYSREAAHRWTRVLLAFCRLSALLVVMGLFSQPALVYTRNQVYPTAVAVAVDRSASMALLERTTPGEITHQTRWQIAIDALTGPTNLLAQLAAQRELGLWDFADAARLRATVRTPADDPAARHEVASAQPNGPRTDIADALNAIFDASRGGRLAAIVLVSDGRQTAPTSIEPAIAAAVERHIPIHTIAVGSSRGRRDVAVARAWTDGDAFVGDFTTLSARVVAEGYPGPTPVTLELRDVATGALLALRRVEIDPRRPPADVELRFRPTQAGKLRLRLTALPRADEDDADNNSADASIQVHDEKIRVLYVESEPRFEYRFLKNTLLREPTLESSILLLSAARDFPQDGTHPIRRFPVSPQELAEYQVVILGDIDPRGDWVSPAQLRMLADFVSSRGGGIAFIAGEHNTLARLRGTPLEKLVPVRIAADSKPQPAAPITESFTPRLTAAGRRHPLFRLEFDSNNATNTSDGAADLLSRLPGWYWFASTPGPVPGAETLVEHPTQVSSDGPLPLVTLGRCGAGRTFYQGTDDTWRWRQHQGESYYDAYWVKIIRLLGREARIGPQHRWRLETDQRQNRIGEPIHLVLTAEDAATAGTSQELTARLSVADGDLVETIKLQRTDPSARTFDASFWPSTPGRYQATADVSVETPSHPTVTVVFDVDADAEERAQPAADHDFLQMISTRSGGKCVEPADAALLANLIPDRSVLVPDDIVQPLWDTKFALLLFVLPITLEWIVRKLRGLA